MLDMGEPVRILHLARRMIELSGFQVRDDDNENGDIEIHFTGLRPGEKLHEELLIGDDNSPTVHPMIKRAREECLPWPLMRRYLDRLSQAGQVFDSDALLSVLWDAVSLPQRTQSAVPLRAARAEEKAAGRMRLPDDAGARHRLSAR